MIRSFLKAGYPCLYLVTQEPHRARQTLPLCGLKRYYAWDCVSGLHDCETESTIDAVTDPADLLAKIEGYTNTVVIAHNLHMFMDFPEVLQHIVNGAKNWKPKGNCLIITSPVMRIPTEIQKYITVIEFPLPNEQQLLQLMTDLGKPYDIPTNEAAATAAKGLTEFEAETAFSRSAIESRTFDPAYVIQAKMGMIKSTNLMEFWPPVDESEIGGLQNGKDALHKYRRAYLPGGEDLPKFKGFILTGIQGTGKSQFAKATASIFGWPLIRLDMQSLQDKYVGGSEERASLAFRTIAAFGECIVWMDEIEKGMGGGGDTFAGGDGNSKQSILGLLLTFMQENKSPVIFMATSNNIMQLPPALIRRFDKLFFVDEPVLEERVEIIHIMNRRYRAEIPDEFAERLNGWTGSEIEQLAKDSRFDDLTEAYSRITPLSVTMADQINQVREWAKRANALRANTPERKITEPRRLQLD
jgi:hypothetical protein